MRHPLVHPRCAHLCMDSPLAGHGTASAIKRQCKGFIQAKAAQCGQKRPIMRVQTRASAMRSLVHGLPVGRARHGISHQAALQGFHSSQVGTMWAKKANNSPEGPNCASRFSDYSFPIDPILFACDSDSPRASTMPSLVQGLPVGKARHVMCHQASVQGFHSTEVGAIWA